MRIYQVELKHPAPSERRFYFFSSKIAIFKHFGEERLGIKYTSLRSNYNLTEQPYDGKECIISEHIVISAKRDLVD